MSDPFPPIVANSDLVESRIPEPTASWEQIEGFALTFNGYDYWGSFEACARMAKKKPTNLTEARTCLFFEQRSWRHAGAAPDGDDLAYVQGLVAQIRRHVSKGEHLIAHERPLPPNTALERAARKLRGLIGWR